MKAGICILMMTTLLTSCCHYRWADCTDKYGNNIKCKIYKSKKWDLKAIFNYFRNTEKFLKYNGTVKVDSFKGFTYIQFDTARIYLSKGDAGYKELIATGLITPKMIYCLMDSDCLPPINYWPVKVDSPSKPIMYKLTAIREKNLTIEYIEPLNYINHRRTQRHFEIGIARSDFTDIVLLEITNCRGTKKMSLSDFLKNAKVTVFKFYHSAI